MGPKTYFKHTYFLKKKFRNVEEIKFQPPIFHCWRHFFKIYILSSMGSETHFKHIIFFNFFFRNVEKTSNPQFFIVEEIFFFLIYLLSSMGSKTHFKYIIFSYIFFGSFIIKKFWYLGSIIFFSLKLPMVFFLESVSIY